VAAETQINILIALQENPDAVQDMINPDNVAQSLINIIKSIRTGSLPGKIIYYVDEADGTAAAQTVTFTQANATEGETVTVLGVVFTAMVASTPSSDPADGEYSAITSDTICAANFKAAVNAHPKLKGLATADNTAGVATVTFTNKGIFGNNGTISETGDLAVVGAATFASGAVGTEQVAVKIDQISKTLA
jgi:hypothetical protein